jgi:hypothetical protein
MHGELGVPPYHNNNLDLENIRVGLRMERAVIGTRLKILGRQVLGAFESYNVALSLAPLTCMLIPPELFEEAFKHDNTPRKY